jgi:Tfp pilus assembly protein PilX
MAMVLVITILAALLGIAAVGLSLQLNSTKSTTLIKDKRSALFCAEAGLAKARAVLVQNRNTWNDVLDGTGAPWYSTVDPLGITGDANGDLADGDYTVTIRDDGDDTDPTTDTNNTIIVTSTCLLFPNSAPATVLEVLAIVPTGQAYSDQANQGSAGVNEAPL